MGVVRWTGEAFKLVGRILTNEDFEKWLEAEGQDFFKKRLEPMSMKWLFGSSRTKRNIKSEVLELEWTGEAFRGSLLKELNSLPTRISEAATILKNGGSKELVEEETLDLVIAIPRKVIIKRYQSSVVGAFENAAALRNFPSLAKRMLLQRTEEAENEFFSGMRKKGQFISDPWRDVILEIDFDTEWWRADIRGHYYVARSFTDTKLTNKANLARFLEKFNPMKDRLKDRIGRMDIKSMDEVLAKLDAIDFTLP